MYRLHFKDRSMQYLMLFVALLFLALAGCETPAPVEPTPPPVVEPEPRPAIPEPVKVPAPVVPVPTASERALADGVALYDAGDFNGAIKMLVGAKAIWEDATVPGGLASKVSANKYIAFSYCVTKRRTLCRQRFVEAIKLDPKFNLEPAEKTHPIWGPEFELARKQASAPPAPVRRPAAPTKPPSSPPKAK
jgi:hypothetical protein